MDPSRPLSFVNEGELRGKRATPNQRDDCNEAWGCPLLLPVPTWSLLPMFLSLGKYSANGTTVGQSPACSSRVVVSRRVQTSSLRPGENTGALCDQGRMEGRVKSRQGVPGPHV